MLQVMNCLLQAMKGKAIKQPGTNKIFSPCLSIGCPGVSPMATILPAQVQGDEGLCWAAKIGMCYHHWDPPILTLETPLPSLFPTVKLPLLPTNYPHCYPTCSRIVSGNHKSVHKLSILCVGSCSSQQQYTLCCHRRTYDGGSQVLPP